MDPRPGPGAGPAVRDSHRADPVQRTQGPCEGLPRGLIGPRPGKRIAFPPKLNPAPQGSRCRWLMAVFGYFF